MPVTTPDLFSVEERARLSAGTSLHWIYQMVAKAIENRRATGGILLDVGCGKGHLWERLRPSFRTYVGCDVVAYDGFPEDGAFEHIDLDLGRLPVTDDFADVTAALETIEHLENPRALFRELVRVTKPGGLVLVTTPNQLSFLSKLTLVFKNQFNAFQSASYPAHITALLEIDLRRMAAECGLTDIMIDYSLCGRIPGTAWHHPRWLARIFPRALSDNVLLIGRKP